MGTEAVVLLIVIITRQPLAAHIVKEIFRWDVYSEIIK